MTAWPSTLPAAPLAKNFQEIAPATVIRTDMDTGPAKVRQRTTAGVGELQATYFLSAAQTETLDDFYATTLAGGALGFDYTHPRTGALLTCRFVSPPEYTAVNGAYYEAAVALEVLP
ncbi:MAG: hypothetical protein KGL10_09665 [Alphaproteobacteria bacterium]|nr:hypothetical protein [Alphaproteobacteria bacterium]MDE2337565.1 hypothetical protein [Alphaproteobacteria bacterium]